MVATVTNIGSASSTVHYFEQDGYYTKGDPARRRGHYHDIGPGSGMSI